MGVGKRREPRNPVPDFFQTKLRKILRIKKILQSCNACKRSHTELSASFKCFSSPFFNRLLCTGFG